MSEYIAKYVSYKEVIRSNTAIKKGIDNKPNKEQLERIKLVAQRVFDPLRKWCGGRVKINSVFRGELLNFLIGGSTTSQHMANNGAAMDIDDVYRHKTNLEMFHYIKDNIIFDQIIAEFPDNGKPRWIHVSYREGNNRGNALIATKINGKTKYLNYEGNENLLY
tara:strand:- start:9884 stop:10375 length:492 start_codon:yes stop_codon:yes gene_type:complete